MEPQQTTSNYTTSHISTPNSTPRFPGYYTLIPLVILVLIGCAAAVVFYIRKKSKLDELRHRLIPLYSYDPAEQPDWWGEDERGEEEELTEPLYKEGKLMLSTPYGR